VDGMGTVWAKYQITSLTSGLVLLAGLAGLAPQMGWADAHRAKYTEALTQEDHPISLTQQERDVRLAHAVELLGKYYPHSAVRSGETVKKINKMIYVWTKERLPNHYKKKYQKVAQAIIDESLKYEFDPVFVMSVIQNESSFDPRRLGSLDEIGLMQLRPGTANWISRKFGLTYYGKRTLYDPIQNIRIGTAYMHLLRQQFDSEAQLYLAAYNMGKHNVENALEKDIWPKDYASHVMHFYVDFYRQIREAHLERVARLRRQKRTMLAKVKTAAAQKRMVAQQQPAAAVRPDSFARPETLDPDDSFDVRNQISLINKTDIDKSINPTDMSDISDDISDLSEN
jgi:soluble lytic murein transglycosylase